MFLCASCEGLHGQSVATVSAHERHSTKYHKIVEQHCLACWITHGFSGRHASHEIGPDPFASDHSYNPRLSIGPPTSAQLVPIPGPIAVKKSVIIKGG